jgi:hypothetical protein
MQLPCIARNLPAIFAGCKAASRVAVLAIVVIMASSMFVKNFGLFWRADEIRWNPGKGVRREFRLLGRRGANLPGLQLADFRFQQGIYILYGNYGPHYVGLTKRQGLGKRLSDHLVDGHSDKWDRFSWFGFCSVRKGKDDHGLHRLGSMARVVVGQPDAVITDVEAILIRAMALQNINQNSFSKAEEWTQVKLFEAEDFLERVRP